MRFMFISDRYAFRNDKRYEIFHTQLYRVHEYGGQYTLLNLHSHNLILVP